MSILGLQPKVEPRDQVLHLADVQNRWYAQQRTHWPSCHVALVSSSA